MKIFYLKFFINEIFFVEKFPNYGIILKLSTEIRAVNLASIITGN